MIYLNLWMTLAICNMIMKKMVSDTVVHSINYSSLQSHSFLKYSECYYFFVVFAALKLICFNFLIFICEGFPCNPSVSHHSFYLMCVCVCVWNLTSFKIFVFNFRLNFQYISMCNQVVQYLIINKKLSLI